MLDLLAICPNVERITIVSIYDAFAFPSAKGYRADVTWTMSGK